MIDAAEIACCSLDGSSCSRKYKAASGDNVCRSGDRDDEKVTWDEANLHCLSQGKRLCNSQEELDKCCGGGCGYDNQLVWSSVKEGRKKLNHCAINQMGFDFILTFFK